MNDRLIKMTNKVKDTVSQIGKDLVAPETLVSIAASVVTGDLVAGVPPALASLGKSISKTVQTMQMARQILQSRDVSVNVDDFPKPHYLHKWHTSLQSSPDDLKKYFARLLAGEMEKPGSFRRKTISVLEDMDSLDAEAFSYLCNRRIVFSKDIEVFFNEVGGSFVYMDRLVRAKLMEITEIGSKIFSTRQQDAQWFDKELCIMSVTPEEGSEDMLVQAFQKGVYISYFNRKSIVYMGLNLPCPLYSMTEEGREISQLIEMKEVDGFWDKVVKKFSQKGIMVFPEEIIQKIQENGSMTFAQMEKCGFDLDSFIDMIFSLPERNKGELAGISKKRLRSVVYSMNFTIGQQTVDK